MTPNLPVWDFPLTNKRKVEIGVKYSFKSFYLISIKNRDIDLSGMVCQTYRNMVRSDIFFLRKEVIHRQLPLPMPCYDFAPVMSIGVIPNKFGTSAAPHFHGVTGGVYKTRERIHRSEADLRLLAIPASWGRVAAPNPNWG